MLEVGPFDFQDKLAEANPAAAWAQHMQVSVKESNKLLRDQGANLWKVVELGIHKALNETDYALAFARRLAPEVAKILAHLDTYG